MMRPRIGALLLCLLVGLAVPAMSAAQQRASGEGPPQSISTPPRDGTSEDVVIPPEQKRAQPPDGDPRSIDQIRAHQAAFDRCLLNAPASSMAHPVESSPEDFCSRRLGMADRNAVPDSVRIPPKAP